MKTTAEIRAWREAHPRERLDLQYADLRIADLRGADLRGANLQGANLRGADLGSANLQGANLQYADLRIADLRGADLGSANLQGANLRGAYLGSANLQGADLRSASVEFVPRCLSASSGSGYMMILADHGEEGLIVHCECRRFTVEQAREHWQLGKGHEERHQAEALGALDYLIGLARSRGWEVPE